MFILVIKKQVFRVLLLKVYKCNHMNKQLVFIAIMVVMLFSISSYGQTPLEFNDKMVAITDTLHKLNKAWRGKFIEIGSGSENFSELKKPRLEIEKYLDGKLKLLKGMKDQNGSKDFRDAIIEYLQFEQNIYHTSYQPIEALNNTSKASEVTALSSNLSKNGKKENEYLDKIRLKQSEFAKRNGFGIE